MGVDIVAVCAFIKRAIDIHEVFIAVHYRKHNRNKINYLCVCVLKVLRSMGNVGSEIIYVCVSKRCNGYLNY